MIFGEGPQFMSTGRGASGRDVVRDDGNHVEVLDTERPPDDAWDLFSAGVYEGDAPAARQAQGMANPRRRGCSIAADVASFAHDAVGSEGAHDVGQWAPGSVHAVDAKIDEAPFLSAWRARHDTKPDYPAVQAYAAG